MRDFVTKRWVYHSITWLCLIGVFLFALQEEGYQLLEYGQILIQIFVPIVLSVYGHFYLKYRFFNQRQYGPYVILLILLITLSVGLSALLGDVIGVVQTGWVQNAVNTSTIILFSTGLQYFKRGIINQYQLQELRAQNAETELNALKTQLNPHFLFNTLNNIYATNQLDAEKGSEMIMELSEVMRYHLQFSTMKTVSLVEEIQLVKSYIELEKLRLNDNCVLTIHLPRLSSAYQIAPLLLLPFIENAFKHGTHPITPCFVEIKIEIVEACLYVEINNSLISHKKTIKTNIGLQNTRRRLAMIYPNRHELEMSQDATSYHVSLQIQL